MKRKMTFIKAVIYFVFYTVFLTAHAQTQSMQLPIPSQNASVINFADPANPAITNLPAQEFRVGGPAGVHAMLFKLRY